MKDERNWRDRYEQMPGSDPIKPSDKLLIILFVLLVGIGIYVFSRLSEGLVPLP